MSAAPLVQLRDVSVVFGGKVRALDGVSLTLDKGDILGLVGESGSGKTTLCKVLMALTTATSGTIAIGGEALPALLPAMRSPSGVARRCCCRTPPPRSRRVCGSGASSRSRSGSTGCRWTTGGSASPHS